MKTRLIALNVHDAVLRLTEGHCDLLLAYDRPSQPLQIAPDRCEMLTLGQEALAPFARADAEGRLLWKRPARSVKKERRARRLAGAVEPGAWELTMEVRRVRERPVSARAVKPDAEALWVRVAQH